MILHALTTEQLLRNVVPASAREATLLERIQELHTSLSLLEKVLEDAGLSTDAYYLESDLEEASKQVEELEQESSRLEERIDALYDERDDLQEELNELKRGAV